MLLDAGTAKLTFREQDLQIRNAFATPIILAAVEQAQALNAALIPLILEREAAFAGVIRSNQGGWQSTDDFTAWSGPAAAPALSRRR